LLIHFLQVLGLHFLLLGEDHSHHFHFLVFEGDDKVFELIVGAGGKAVVGHGHFYIIFLLGFVSLMLSEHVESEQLPRGEILCCEKQVRCGNKMDRNKLIALYFFLRFKSFP
jgi:hypothetical protein